MKDEKLIDQMREAVTYDDMSDGHITEVPAVNDACLLSLANMVRDHDFAKMDVISAEQHDNKVIADERARFKAAVIEAVSFVADNDEFTVETVQQAIEEL